MYLRSSGGQVEQQTDFDKLIIELETNGTVDPEQAVKEAASCAAPTRGFWGDKC